jgi:hypothetical protein
VVSIFSSPKPQVARPPGQTFDDDQKRNSPSSDMWCVLGTLGSFLAAALLSAPSLFFRFLLSPPAFCADDEDDPEDEDVAATDSPAAMSLAPLSDLDGFEDEHLRWWAPRTSATDPPAVAALGAAAAANVETMPLEGAEQTTRRTDEGSMMKGLLFRGKGRPGSTQGGRGMGKLG